MYAQFETFTWSVPTERPYCQGSSVVRAQKHTLWLPAQEVGLCSCLRLDDTEYVKERGEGHVTRQPGHSAPVQDWHAIAVRSPLLFPPYHVMPFG